MVIDNCKTKIESMALEQRLARWKRKKGSPFKELKPQQRKKWRDLGINFSDIAERKKSEIKSKTGEMIDESIQLAKVGEMGPAILIPSLEDVQEDFLKKEPEISKPKKTLQPIRHVTGKPRRTDSGLGHLDFMLNSEYVHGKDEIFPETVDIYFQPQTVGATKRSLVEQNKYNKTIISREENPLCKEAGELRLLPDGTCRYILRSVPERSHPIKYGGLREHNSVHSVKLAISSSHMPQTKNGYSRKVDGAFFCV